jgi:DNA-directed RNA polymerase subunit P
VIVASENTEGDSSTISNENTVGSVIYECMRCGTPVSNEELSKLPEIKCICGFRVFRKARQPIVKQVKAI